jgi:hypothetical protein
MSEVLPDGVTPSLYRDPVPHVHQLGQDKPLFAVQEFSDDIELTGMTRRLLNDMQDNFPQRLDSPIAELLSWPPPWLGVERNRANYLIRPIDLFQVTPEDH